ncbi:MAG: TerB family tellurite resistance protein [Symplocastrum torsivum CPER-KK1]|jgi:uncharacterized tellurite resistance protein B-like protein|uniref:TerB family tellurite resistance protein n=1 Tax=Symplocastrum torsivum CPER-KK1 TaxID=450513 RepID=A0A951PQ66_9CYAN|nr:TerB family tellurite resistance protein [Symplocastrum torsivum CPER-KK1]
MDTALVGSETIDLLSRITGQKLNQQDLTPSIIFLTALVTVLLGVMYADGTVTDAEIRQLLTALNRFTSLDTDARRLAHRSIKGIRENQVYAKTDDLKMLMVPLSESERLLLLAICYEISVVDGEVNSSEKQYWQSVGNWLQIESQHLAVLEAGFSTQEIIDAQALEKVYSLLNPAQFEPLGSLFVKAANQILVNLPDRPQSDQRVESYSPELKESAKKLKELVQACLDELRQAEDVWDSKTRISEIAQEDICEQIGEISGRDFKILQLGKQCKLQAAEQIKKSWEERIERLRKKWFVDAKQQSKKGIGWNEKEGFIKDIRPQIDSQSSDLTVTVRQSLSVVYQEVADTNLELIERCLNLLDQNAKTELSYQINSILNDLKTKFCNIKEHPPSEAKVFRVAVSSPLGALVNKGWGDIYWEEIVKFKNEVSSTIDDIVTAIFDDRVKLATQALAKVISFYDDFLERQERYQQETPEQRDVEKAWIAQKRNELERMQKNIEVMLLS